MPETAPPSAVRARAPGRARALAIFSAALLLVLLPASASGQPLEANVNFDPEADMFTTPMVALPAFLDILESSIELSGDPGTEVLVLRMTVAEPIDISRLPTGPTSQRGKADRDLSHPAVISDVVWRFGLDTDASSVHSGFPYPPGTDSRPALVTPWEYLVDVAWDFEGFRAELVASGIGSTASLDFEIAESAGRGTIQIRLPAAQIGGMAALDNLTWQSATLYGFGSPCAPGICLKYIADISDPSLSFAPFRLSGS